MAYQVALIILYDSEKRFLLQYRSDDAKLLPSHWAFFGGGIKEGEKPEEGVRREAFEEINYKLKAPQLILEQKFQEDNVEGYMYVYIEAFHADKLQLWLREGQDWGWFNKSEIADLKMLERDREIIRFISHYLENNTANKLTKCTS
jgi:8-oxo-dGTP pyrophosphatase MutT (NUDIX family)